MLFHSNIETLVHLLKCSLGTGILAMPQAFARSGLVTGIIATVLVGILITHCLHVLVSYLFQLQYTRLSKYCSQNTRRYLLQLINTGFNRF